VCLADDMGLGKTIQVIAYLLYRKEHYPQYPGSTLIICPTSIMYNWQRELEKFAPDLEVILHHGADRLKDSQVISEYTKPHRIIITSYGTLRNDVDILEPVPFGGVIIDESQNIKNYASQQTQAVYSLQGQYRVALSGTPIENRLMELWSLFEFLNPGIFGSRTEFQKNYVLPIERFQDQHAIERLKAIIAPFIMRRVKTDENIIDDLPEKNEMKIYMELSESQIMLYRRTVEDTLKQMENAQADNRKKRGLVLKLLMQLKQICNHPYHFLKKTSFESEQYGEVLKQSKKLQRVVEITDEVIDKGEKVLIFTQFKKMGDLLLETLSYTYEFEILFFHGSVPAKTRKTLIDEFQSQDPDSAPILILSLKAGGTGLNLTQGTTVVHFDRWWNPAVENQATDRAYRIGQTKNVNVYKFITVGTIEEKIDKLLEEKQDLAEKVVESTGESWISDLDEEKLKELLTLDV